MKIIFLDFDGVLNSDEFLNRVNSEPHGPGFGSMMFAISNIDPQALPYLDKIVDATGAKIVISSSWRAIWSWREIRQILQQAGFKNYTAVIDQTPRSTTGFRGKEIDDWFGMFREKRVVSPEEIPVQSYVILDDSTDFTTEQQSHFVNTNPDVGLTEEDAAHAIEILSGDMDG